MAVKARISGRVQGVGYRAWTVATARRLGLKGWVRNRTDGTVEALFAGEEKIIFAMLEACMQGPPAARVNEVKHEETSEENIGEQFHSRPTA